MRTCVGCRRVRPASELVRVVRRADGSLAPGRTLPGRGAWLCKASPPCLELAIKRRAFDRAFRAPIRPSETEALQAQLGAPYDDKLGPFA